MQPLFAEFLSNPIVVAAYMVLMGVALAKSRGDI
jgi:hypothetical protein